MEPHPLTEHDFLGHDDEYILNRRVEKHKELEESKNNPEKYFEKQRVEHAGNRAKVLLERVKEQNHGYVDVDVDLDEDGNPLPALEDDVDVVEDADVELTKKVNDLSGVVIHKVNKLIINIYK